MGNDHDAIARPDACTHHGTPRPDASTMAGGLMVHERLVTTEMARGHAPRYTTRGSPERRRTSIRTRSKVAREEKHLTTRSKVVLRGETSIGTHVAQCFPALTQPPESVTGVGKENERCGQAGSRNGWRPIEQTVRAPLRPQPPRNEEDTMYECFFHDVIVVV